MPDNLEWPERKVDPDNFAGLGCQTKSLHETLALLALVSSERYVYICDSPVVKSKDSII